MQFLSTVIAGSLLACGSFAANAAAPPHGDADVGAQKAFACAACHGFDGNSSSPQFPSLAGQDAGYIATQLQSFKDGERANQIMLGMASALSSPSRTANVRTRSCLAWLQHCRHKTCAISPRILPARSSSPQPRTRSPQPPAPSCFTTAIPNMRCRHAPLVTVRMAPALPVRPRAWPDSSPNTCAAFSERGKREPPGANPPTRKSCRR